MSRFNFPNFNDQLSRLGADVSREAISFDQRVFREAEEARTRKTDQQVADLSRLYKELKNRYGGSRGSDPVSSDVGSQKAFIEKIIGSYALPSRFTIFVEGVGWETNERLARNCQSVSLPGRAFQSQPHKIYGPPREHIYEVNYPNEIQLTFRVGEDMFERDFFDMWMNKSASYSTFDLSYPDEYMTAIKIYQLDKQDNYLYCMQLYNAFCKNIGDIELSADASDQIETVTVTIGYSEHQVIGYRYKNWVSQQRASMMKEDIKAFIAGNIGDLPSSTRPTPSFGQSIPWDTRTEGDIVREDLDILLRSSVQQVAPTAKLPSVGGVPTTSANPGVADPIESNIYNTSSSAYGISSRGGVPISIESGESTAAATTSSVPPGGVPTSVEGGDIDQDEIDDGIGPKYPPTPPSGSSIPIPPPS